MVMAKLEWKGEGGRGYCVGARNWHGTLGSHTKEDLVRVRGERAGVAVK